MIFFLDIDVYFEWTIKQVVEANITVQLKIVYRVITNINETNARKRVKNVLFWGWRGYQIILFYFRSKIIINYWKKWCICVAKTWKFNEQLQQNLKTFHNNVKNIFHVITVFCFTFLQKTFRYFVRNLVR